MRHAPERSFVAVGADQRLPGHYRASAVDPAEAQAEAGLR